MAGYTQHEVWDVQEHIRSEAASAQVYSQFAQVCTDADLRQFCQDQARIAVQNTQRLLSLIQLGNTH